MGIIEEYRNVANKQRVISKYPTAVLPVPDQKDYLRGYIVRYFIRLKTNIRFSIYEIDEKQYKKFNEFNLSTNSNEFLFYLTDIRWKIIGKREEVEFANTKSVNNREQNFKEISLKLSNRLQFWKPT